jgi:hypothetical protein
MNDHKLLSTLELSQSYISCQLAIEQHIKDGLYQLALSRRSSSVTLGTMFTRSVENCRLELDPLYMVTISDKDDVLSLVECDENQQNGEKLDTNSFDSCDSDDKCLSDIECVPKKTIKDLLNEMVVVVSGSGLPPKGMKNAQNSFSLALNEIIQLANLKKKILNNTT